MASCSKGGGGGAIFSGAGFGAAVWAGADFAFAGSAFFTGWGLGWALALVAFGAALAFAAGFAFDAVLRTGLSFAAADFGAFPDLAVADLGADFAGFDDVAALVADLVAITSTP